MNDAQLPPPQQPSPPPAAAQQIEPADVDAGPVAVRRGPGNGGKKANNKMVAERVHQVSQLLVRRIPKYQIKRLLKEKYGLGFRQAESYLSRAKQHLLERSQRPRDDVIGEVLGTYEDVLRNPEATVRDRLEASAAIRELFGLDAPRKIAATTPDGRESAALVNFDMRGLPDNVLRRAAEATMLLRAHAAGKLIEAVPDTDGQMPHGPADVLPPHAVVIDEPRSAAGSGPVEVSATGEHDPRDAVVETRQPADGNSPTITTQPT